jgi:hypothetical protein
MTAQMNVKPIDEQNYLKRNALGGLLVGGLWSSEIITNFITLTLESSPVSFVFFGVVSFALLIALIFSFFKALSSANKVTKDTIWCGNFQDEYLNHVNLKGYKYAFNSVLFILLLVYALVGFEGTAIGDALLSIELQDFCKLIMSTIFFSYGFVVLYLLKGADDE